MVLISFILLFIPAHRAFSVDARLFKNLRAATIPAWNLWLIRFTIALPYFFGGVAKINGDWLSGEPMRSWLSYETDFPLIGPLFTKEWMIYFISYSGLLLDLLVVPLLLFKRTRVWAFILAVLFHLMNARLFQIGIFPWFMLLATTLYFHPSWPRIFLKRKDEGKKKKKIKEATWKPPVHLLVQQKLVVAGLTGWLVLHMYLPLRHFLIPGNVHWTEEGHRFAWHMKLRSKEAFGYFIVKDKKTGAEEMVNADQYLVNWQEEKMFEWPELTWQFARKIKQEYSNQGKDVSVHANVMGSLNGRAYQQLVDPAVDLSTASRPGFVPASWIVPLRVPLNQRAEETSEQEE